ncbi:hypothetical protein [Marinifilum caeruleilacunae]|uniref:YtxH domain-containing protein n=1 Tax=Marinifilum caeruleilacunae TaxID=2499076 RepID=A0ABX1WXU8_9BACT|nr:hypothetical protein [Marinifilum caeruleilacunae]NOU60713.1 hypothetical protein [Marinifilum caeruleilacunae]
MENKGNLTTGILIGVGVSLGAYYLYNKNKAQINEFLRSQGINIPESNDKGFDDMNIEELVSTKEHIEDLIAEMEQKLKEDTKE